MGTWLTDKRCCRGAETAPLQYWDHVGVRSPDPLTDLGYGKFCQSTRVRAQRSGLPSLGLKAKVIQNHHVFAGLGHDKEPLTVGIASHILGHHHGGNGP